MGRYISGTTWGQRPPRQVVNSDYAPAPALVAGTATIIKTITGAGRLKHVRAIGMASDSGLVTNVGFEVLVDGVSVFAPVLVGTWSGGAVPKMLIGHNIDGGSAVASEWDSIAFTRSVEIRATAANTIPANQCSATLVYELY